MTIFENQNSKGQSRLMSIGDVINGWTIAEIEGTSLKLRWKDQEKVIDMFDSAPQQAARSARQWPRLRSPLSRSGRPQPQSKPLRLRRLRQARTQGGLVVGVTGGQGGQPRGTTARRTRQPGRLTRRQECRRLGQPVGSYGQSPARVESREAAVS